MDYRHLSVRVSEDLKRQVKNMAANKDQSVQDFIGEIVLGYINNVQQSSKVAALDTPQRTVVDTWAAAFMERDEAAKTVYKIMELWHERWKQQGFIAQPGDGKTEGAS